MALTAGQLNRATLQRQLLLQRHHLPVVDAVRKIVAIQAQEAASPYVALWNRVSGFDPSELDRAFADGVVVKASLMRITLHAVHRDEYTTFHEGVLSTLRASRLNDRRFDETGMGIEEADALIEHLVAYGSEPRTKAEIETMLGERLGIEPHGRLWKALRTYAPMIHAPVDAPWSFGRTQVFRTAPTEPERMSREDSLRALVERYLEGFGPATRHDFGRFTLLAQSTVKPVLDRMDHLERLVGPDGEDLLDVPGGRIPDDDVPAPPRLMAMWDSVLLAHADRTRVMSDEYRKLVIRSNGDVLPTLLVDGRVAGVWRHVDGRIEATAFHELGADEWEGLEAESVALLSLLEGRDRSVYGRYRRWWEKLPAGETRLLP